MIDPNYFDDVGTFTVNKNVWFIFAASGSNVALDNIHFEVTYNLSTIDSKECVLTQNMYYDFSALWRSYEIFNQRPSWKIYNKEGQWANNQGNTAYLYWSDRNEMWMITDVFGTDDYSNLAYYICSEEQLADCVAGEWKYRDIVYTQDWVEHDDATIVTDTDCYRDYTFLSWNNTDHPIKVSFNFLSVSTKGLGRMNEIQHDFEDFACIFRF